MAEKIEEATVYDLLESDAVPVSEEEMKAFGLGVATAAVVDVEEPLGDGAKT